MNTSDYQLGAERVLQMKTYFSEKGVNISDETSIQIFSILDISHLEDRDDFLKLLEYGFLLYTLGLDVGVSQSHTEKKVMDMDKEDKFNIANFQEWDKKETRIWLSEKISFLKSVYGNLSSSDSIYQSNASNVFIVIFHYLGIKNQSELAKKMFISKSYISQIKSGNRPFPESFLQI